MKEKDLLKEKLTASFGAIFSVVFATLATQATGSVSLILDVAMSVVYLGFALVSLKYILFDSKIVELKDEIDTLLSLKASHGEFRELGNQFREIRREHAEDMVLVSERFMNQSLSSGKIATLQAQFNAVNEHYGIEIEKVEAGYRVK